MWEWDTTLSDSSFSTSFLILLSMQGFRIMCKRESWSGAYTHTHTVSESTGVGMNTHDPQTPRDVNLREQRGRQGPVHHDMLVSEHESLYPLEDRAQCILTC